MADLKWQTGALDLYWAIGAMQSRQGLYAPMSRRVMVVGAEALAQAWVKLPLVQILVVVANIQMTNSNDK